MGLILIALTLIIIIFKFKILKKCEEFNIDTILKYGVLSEQIFMKGDIFYKGIVKKENFISYLIYVRLDNGKEITIDNPDVYSSLNIGDIAVFSKNKYTYINQELNFYTVCLGDLENIRLNETIEFL